MNIKIESGAKVQITDKPIVNVFGDVVQHKEVNVYPERNDTETTDAAIIEEPMDSNWATNGEEELNEGEELNYEAPKINLQQLLKQPWFAEARSEEKYDSKWTDAFVEALMGSEYGEGIARDWNNGGRLDRCTQIKGYLLGLLKDASVLKGSYDAIAEKANLMDNPRSFSRYMANGKKQPYAQWVKGYVKGEGI